MDLIPFFFFLRDAPSSTPRRFVPRPSPERLAAQIQGLEATQERVTELLTSQNRQLIEEFKQHSAGVMDEMRNHRLSSLEEMKNQRQNVTDLKMEMKQGLHDVKVEVAKLSMVMKEATAAANAAAAASASAAKAAPSGQTKVVMDPAYHQELKDALANLPRQLAAALPPPPPPQVINQPPPVSSSAAPGAANGAKGLTLSEMQEALAQQTALLQMSGFGFAAAGMFARPPLPPPGGPPVPPPHGATVPPPPVLPTQPLPPTQAQTSAPGPWNQPPANITQQPPAPETARPPPPAPVSVVQAPPPAANTTTSASTASPVGSPKLHDYQINLPKTAPIPSPFKEQDGPAVPIVTTALLSSIPSPAFSSLAKTPPSNKPPPAATASPVAVPAVQVGASSAGHAAPTASLFDKFKPKAGSWECGGCMLRNEEVEIECPSCETPQPGHEEEAKQKKEAKEAAAKPAVTFGAGGGFKFGMPAGSEAPKAGGFGGFSFGGDKPAAGAAGGGFSFAVPKGDSSASGSVAVPTGEDGHLSFEGKGLKLNEKKDADPVVADIANFKNMKKLTFSGNTVGIEAAGAIGQALEKHSEFEEAHWKDMFTGRMKTEIPPALKNLSAGILKAQARLTVLDLSDNAFGPIGMEGIVDLLRSPCCYTLRELKLNNTGCGTAGGTKLAQTLMECYNASTKAGKPLALKVFILGRSRQENDGATALAKVFKVMGSLEEVIMPQNGIYHDGIKALADAFSKNPNLKTLNMNDNTFTEKGAKYMADALRSLQKLTYLNLGDCLIKTDGAIAIANALKGGHSQLEELHMDSNEIKLPGGEELVKVVKDKASMKKLYIGTNLFGEAGCQKLIELLGDKQILLPEGEIEDDEGDEEDSTDEAEGDDTEVQNDTSTAKDDASEKPSPFAGFSFSTGSSSTPGAPGGGLFGTNSGANTSGSIFGGAGAGGSSSVFGTPTQAASTAPAASTSIFGTPSSESTSVFGTPSGAGTSLFGGASQNANDSSAPTGFAALAAKSSEGGFSFGKPADSKPFSFAGAGATLFKPSPTKPNESTANPDDSAATEDDGHDPHFEPIIPLPELVKVTTGEEEEEVLFKHRAKVYRFDKDSKQWKERGIGDMKILKHGQKNTFRVLLRREQIHKIACNHLISTDMELKPMASSETAVTWFAMDYADDEGKLENLAVRFKLTETLNDFKKVFEDCQEQLKNKPPSPVKPTASVPAAAAPAAAASTLSSPPKPESSANQDDSAAAEDDGHDPHYDPIIPLPELVQVTTGEEDEEVLFKHRAKVYRFDKDAKQWKERGVGDMKILKHVQKNTFRVLLRREQIHKIACNHLISAEMELKPMSTSETAVTWFAMDYADDEAKLENLAVRFKLAETLNDFKKVFEDCQEQLKKKPPTQGTPGGSGVEVIVAKPANEVFFQWSFCYFVFKLRTFFPNEQEEDSQDGNDEDDEEEEENIMYERECTLQELGKDEGATPTGLGEVLLKIVYDDDVYGARIVAHSTSGDEDMVCNHLIAMQTSLESDKPGQGCSWSALDFSLDPPAYRNFRASFKSNDDEQVRRTLFK